MSDALASIRAALAPYIAEPDRDFRRLPEGQTPKTSADYKRAQRAVGKAARLRCIAVLDMETDPFDPASQEFIFPFVACLYSDQFDAITIWEEDRERFVDKVVAAIEALPDEFTIYAHNGGKFDWQFLMRRIRGQVAFKGRAIMAARIGNHHIRDSFHLLPEKLAAYRKDEFDYSKLTKAKRNKHRAEIEQYLLNDCVYLFEMLRAFTAEHGLKLSIGQAALAAMRGAGYKVEHLSEGTDAYLRHYLFGGRVECIQGKGKFDGAFKLYDVNSMYPYVMSRYLHPTSRDFTVRDGEPGSDTVFLELDCVNHGALVGRGSDGETSAKLGRGTFKTTIWEYEVARKYNLIEDVKIKWCIDFPQRQTFEKFVEPFYNRRQDLKTEMRAMLGRGVDDQSEEYLEAKRSDIFLKFLLNNCWGKQAQNPRNYKETYITDLNVRAPPLDVIKGEIAEDDMTPAMYLAASRETWGDLPVIENRQLGYAIWERPTDRLRFNNVAMGASITGAARAVLLEAMCNAVDPIYCDTDSLICRELRGHDLDKARLGAWDLEDEFVSVIIAGKKTYACDKGENVKLDKRYKIRSKGTAGLTWADMLTIINDEIGEVSKTARAPTLSRSGQQVYMTRRIRATAGTRNVSLLDAIKRRMAA